MSVAVVIIVIHAGTILALSVLLEKPVYFVLPPYLLGVGLAFAIRLGVGCWVRRRARRRAERLAERAEFERLRRAEIFRAVVEEFGAEARLADILAAWGERIREAERKAEP